MTVTPILHIRCRTGSLSSGFFKGKQQNASNFPYFPIELMICNNMCNILFAERYQKMEDEGLLTIMEALDYFDKGLYHADPVSVLPWLRFFPIQSFKLLKKYRTLMDGYISKRYDEHSQRLDPSNITSFLSYMINASRDDQVRSKHPGMSELSRDNIEAIMSNMVLASIDTTVSDLAWLILRLLHHPVYIDEALEEIRSVIGVNMYPEIKDRSSLPKVQAIIQESLRLTAGPFSLQHKATKDSSIAGNSIRKGTELLFDMWNIHRDKRYWTDPNKFQPFRWLDEDGKFNTTKHKSFMPFLMGKRACLGEQIARAEIFLLMTRLIVDFKMEQDPAKALPKLTEGIMGIGFCVLPFKVVLTKR